jgi:hypothetical protein
VKRVLPGALALCLLLTACASRTEEPETEPTEKAEDRGLLVHTDWSHLGQREELPSPVGSRWYEDYTDQLIPRDDYGTLIPYAGLRLMDNWPAGDGCMYGLMTQAGQVVTDPVYSTVTCPGYGSRRFPLLILRTSAPDGEEGGICAVAAADGSWCTPFVYRGWDANSQGLLLFQEDSVTVMTPEEELRRTWTAAEMGISQAEFDSVLSEVVVGDGWGGQRRGDYMALGWDPESDYTDLRCFDVVSGGIQIFTMEEWEALDDTVYEEKTPVIPNAWRISDQLFGDDAPGLLELTEYSGDGDTTTYYREDGTPLPDFTLIGHRWYEQVSLVGGLIQRIELNCASYYDLDTLECRFRTYWNYDGD